MLAEFLHMRQGNLDLQAYIQKMRYTPSCIVGLPMDMAKQVTAFMTGLKHVPVKTQLLRGYPGTIEEALSRALCENFNADQARFGFRYRPSDNNGAKPMDVSVTQDSDDAVPNASVTVRQAH
ncbi:hypothetical protein PsorP6_004812 [Peronosclerospora sorghi]|uniref:Uncharacterized protein n=1 Tax=Peronosclerospora sorghi TaxID=230839 RepID=A0ACC0VLS5_9STRA|nr:hypothetical protein PsorP6_004812 [Peronosclerospora sorghi]